MPAAGPTRGYADGVRSAVRNNLGAFGFSVVITSAFGLVQHEAGNPTVPDVFLFAGGAAAGFVVVDALASRLFRTRLRGETPEVVAVGAALSFLSIGLSVGAAALGAAVVKAAGAWALASFAATGVYVLVGGLELTLARRIEEAGDGHGDDDDA